MLRNIKSNMAEIAFGVVFARDTCRYRYDDDEREIERPIIDRANPLENLNDMELHRRFRFRREGLLYITNLKATQIARPTRRNHALPAVLQVFISLRFLATGSFYSVIGDGYPRVSTSTVCRVFWEVVGALLYHLNTFVHFPRPENFGAIKQQFYSIAGFPNVIGAVDRTQIPIVAPTKLKLIMSTGKMVCDPWLRITNVVAKWPGSVHDARIFKESTLGREMQAGVHNGLLLGDSGYPCRKYLMVPYSLPTTRDQNKFNSALVKTRVLIEQTFGVLKRKFACLKYLRVAPDKACKVVCVTAMLHNIAVQFHDIDDEGELDLTEQHQVPYQGHREQGKHFRDLLARNYFS